MPSLQDILLTITLVQTTVGSIPDTSLHRTSGIFKRLMRKYLEIVCYSVHPSFSVEAKVSETGAKAIALRSETAGIVLLVYRRSEI
jgi:hypothetical protein